MKIDVTGGSDTEWDLIPQNEMIDVRLEIINHNNRGEYERLSWVFEVVEPGEFLGRKVYGSTSLKFVRHPECKAYNWAMALSGDDYADATEFDTDSLIGMTGRVIVEHSPDRKDPNKIWVNVKDVYPPKQVVRQTSPLPENAPF